MRALVPPSAPHRAALAAVVVDARRCPTPPKSGLDGSMNAKLPGKTDLIVIDKKKLGLIAQK